MDNAERRPFGADEDPVTFAIIGAAQKVHSALGMGFTEAVYQAALCKELSLRNTPFVCQKEFHVHYEGTLCGVFRTDLVVEDVIVELKAVAELCKEHRLQTISYLKASGLKRALLINFGAQSLEVRRLTNDAQQSGQR